MTFQNETATHGCQDTEAAPPTAEGPLDQEGLDDPIALAFALPARFLCRLKYAAVLLRPHDSTVTHCDSQLNLVVERMSAPYVEGASIDFPRHLEQQGF